MLEPLRGLGLGRTKAIRWNLSATDLRRAAVANGEGVLTRHGHLVVHEGQRSGRTADATAVVPDNRSGAPSLWSDSSFTTASRHDFDRILARVSSHFSERSAYVFDGYAGADPKHQLPIRVVTDSAWLSLFARNMWFPAPPETAGPSFQPAFAVVDVPRGFVSSSQEPQIILDLKRRVALVAGTPFAGEVKNPVTTYLTYSLPDVHTLPLHSSLNFSAENGDAALFIGLSGTGKTTLGLVPSRLLIGDDFHGWNSDGVFTFERGCYGSAHRLLETNSDSINYMGSPGNVGAVLQDVAYDESRDSIDWASTSPAASCCVPIDAMYGSAPYTGRAAAPANVFLLVADAFGVLPALCALTPSQAAFIFLVGYTSKMPGTEVDVERAIATFSPCYAAPYLLREPTLYAEMFLSLIEEARPALWLLNTGWLAGPAATGTRIPIRHTIGLVEAVLRGSVTPASCVDRGVFGYRVPPRIPGVPIELLEPRRAWSAAESYDETARRLARSMRKSFAQYGGSRAAGKIGHGAPELWI